MTMTTPMTPMTPPPDIDPIIEYLRDCSIDPSSDACPQDVATMALKAVHLLQEHIAKLEARQAVEERLKVYPGFVRHVSTTPNMDGTCGAALAMRLTTDEARYLTRKSVEVRVL